MTRISTPVLGEGWASSVETWCLTFSKGRACVRVSGRRPDLNERRGGGADGVPRASQ